MEKFTGVELQRELKKRGIYYSGKDKAECLKILLKKAPKKRSGLHCTIL